VPLEMTDTRPDAGQAELRRASPIWKVPVAETDGRFLFDSRVIIDWITTTRGWGGVEPPRDRWHGANLVNAIDGALESAVQVFYLRRDGLDVTTMPFAQRQRDRIGCITFDNDIVTHIPPSATHLERVLHTLDRAKPERKGDLKVPMQKMAEHFGRRGILVIVSDLYENPEAIMDAVKPLRYRGNDLVVFHVLDPAEIDFNFTEAASFQDLETGEQIPVVPSALAAQYKSLVQEHIAALTSRFSHNRVDYTLVNTATPLDYALFKYLSARQRLSRVR
jgi:hypothetical protein